MTVLPSPEQQDFARLPIEDVLLIAPAGCGKTQALAERAATLMRRGDISRPRKILALTFSNKAKANLASRMRERVGGAWREHIDVTNLHGLAARIIRAHGGLIGIGRDVELPDKAWRARFVRSCGVTYANGDSFETALRAAKSGDPDDQEVLDRLEQSGNELAIEFERRMRDENRLDFDDLLRYGRRLLSNRTVADLYRNHFAAVLLDEIQDLSLTQLSLVQAIGHGRTTYAGDPAQGIYSFAGAEPNLVFASVRGCCQTIVELNSSYRSAPRVLAAINGVAKQMGVTALVCANPEAWQDEGTVAVLERRTPSEEAAVLLDHLPIMLGGGGNRSVGLIVRRGSRLTSLRTQLDEGEIPYEDWTSPTHVGAIVELLNRHLSQAIASSTDAVEQLRKLRTLCASAIDPTDIESLGEVASACEALEELVVTGSTLKSAVSRCRRSGNVDDPVQPGIHILNGHVGKGQEFDWVAVVGMEDGHVPDFRATSADDVAEDLRVLHVMASRARVGLVFTCCAEIPTKFGARAVERSRWWPLLAATADSRW